MQRLLLPMFVLNLRYLGQRKYKFGEMYWMTFPWPRPKVMAVAITAKFGGYIPLIMLITWLNFGGILWGWFFFFFFLISNVFFKAKHYLPYHRNGLSIEEKCKRGALIGYWLTMWPLPFSSSPMTFDLGFSRSNFEIVSQELSVWLMWNKKVANQVDTRPTMWPCPLSTPIILALDFQGQSLK